jgi:hypothetical protein
MTSQDQIQLASLKRLALRTLEKEGFQAPSAGALTAIVQCSMMATSLFLVAALRVPSASELDEFFKDFVLRSVNLPPGVGDAKSN